jgi:P27 family predicted phage terminase small subunit
MGQRGPVKGSRRFDVVKGGQKAKTPEGPSKPRAKRPAVPKWLPPEGRKLLRKIIPELEVMFESAGGLKEGDAAGLAALALHYAILVAACEQITKVDGKKTTLELTTGDPDHPTEDGEVAIRKHPLLSVITTNSEKLKQWITEFAYTPAARVRLNIKPPKGASKLAKFLNEG